MVLTPWTGVVSEDEVAVANEMEVRGLFCDTPAQGLVAQKIVLVLRGRIK